jgi:hypothetical protein
MTNVWDYFQCSHCRGIYTRGECAVRRGVIECPRCILQGLVGLLCHIVKSEDR